MALSLGYFTLGLAVLALFETSLDRTNAWLARQRNNATENLNPTETVLLAPAMLESQWGSSYYPVPVSRTSEGLLDFVFSEAVNGQQPGQDNNQNGDSDTSTPGGDSSNACSAPGMLLNKKLGTTFHTVIDVASADACQTACSNHGRCKAASYHGKSRICDLVDTLDGFHSSTEFTIVLPNCDSTCFTEGSKPADSGTSLGVAKNANICQFLCLSDASCMAFSWSKGDSQCTGHTDSNNKALLSPLHVSGPKESCKSNEKGFDYAGTCEEKALSPTVASSEMIHTESNEECRNICYSAPTCHWVTYNTVQRMCHLKPSRGRMAFIVDVDVTYPKLCDSSCFRKDSAVVGKSLAVINDAKNPHYCHYECWMNADCSFWEWQGTASQTCNLYGAAAGLVSQYAKGHWSGASGGCGAEAEYIQQPDLAGGGIVKYATSPADWYLTISAVKDVDECMEWCDTEERCKFFSFEAKDGLCRLSEFVNVAVFNGNTSQYVGLRSGSSSRCYKDNFLLTSNTVEAPASTTATPAFCQARCQETSGCNGFVWYKTSGSCVFKASGNFSVGKTSVGVVSGPKNACYRRQIRRPYNYCAENGDNKGGCGHQGVKPDSEVVKQMTTSDIGSCRKECWTMYPGCEAYLWNGPNNQCTLYKDIGNNGPVVSNTNDFSGPAVCDSSCFYKGHKFSGTPLTGEFNGIFGIPHDCLLKCRMHNECNGWTYNSQLKTCQFFSAVESMILKPAADSWSGRWSFCDTTLGARNTDGCINPLFTTGGVPDYKTVENILNQAECMRECRTSVGCIVSTYNTAAKKCYLKNGVDFLVPRDLDFGDQTAPRECRGDCFLRDYRFNGPNVDGWNAKTSALSAQMCQTMCVARAATCAVWSYNFSNDHCELKTKAALTSSSGPASNGGTGWVSGHNHFCY